MKVNRKIFKRYFLATLILLAIFVWYVIYREDRRGVLSVTFFDVGQGDAIFIESPNGNQILLDAGPDKKILRLLGSVMPFYDRHIDLLAVSHPHLDHFGGLLSVVQRYKVGGLISSGTINETSEFDLFQSSLASRGIRGITLKRGMEIDMGDGVVLDVLFPDRDASSLTPHDGMLVMRLVYGSTSILLTGDMEENLESYLVALEGDDLRSQVLKVGHHGSRTSTSQSFLGYVSPVYAVISSGRNNRYGHPHKDTMESLDRFDIKVFRTDQQGTIKLKSDGESLSIR